MVVIGLLRTFVRVLSWLPLEGARGIASGIGTVVWHLPTEMSRITAINIKLCFPELSFDEQAKLGQQSVKETLKIGFEYGVIWHWPLPKWRGLIREVSGWDQVEKARASGSGILLLVPHLGNWEMLNAFLSEQTQFVALFDPPKQSSVAESLFTARNRVGTELQPIGVAGLRNVYKALSAQRVVLVLPDQVPDRRAGTYAPFFKHPALTMSFGLRILHKSNAVAFCAVATRVKGGFDLHFEPFPEALYDTNIDVQAVAMNAGIENAIRETPEQYQWEYKRFKRPPEGMPDLYKKS